jgi:Nitrile hydratase beta subunit, C-terminal
VRYRTGESVRVADRPHDGHHRTPGYLKGKTGLVERAHPAVTNPETRAYGGDGLPEQRLYLISVSQRDLWSDYRGAAADRVFVEVFEHWLEKAE